MTCNSCPLQSTPAEANNNGKKPEELISKILPLDSPPQSGHRSVDIGVVRNTPYQGIFQLARNYG